jgi:hypothetical protein
LKLKLSPNLCQHVLCSRDNGTAYIKTH